MSLEKVAIRNGPIAQLVPGGNSPLYKLVIEHGALTGEIPEYITDYNLYYGPIAQLVPGGNSPLYKLVIEHGALTGEIPEYITDYNLYYGPIAQLVRAPAF